MEELKRKEKNRKKEKRKLMVTSALMTIITVIFVLIVLSVVFFKNDSSNYITPNSYSFTGNTLSTSLIYSDIYLVIEEKDNSLFGVTLKNNELVSEKVLCSSIDYSDINDFGIVLDYYNNDNNKDFIYLSDKTEKGYCYKFYSIDRLGNINEMELKNIEVNSNRASLSLTKVNEEYKYIPPIFYYDGYKVTAEIGNHELLEKSDINKKTISKTSKIAVDEKYKAVPRKISVLEEVPQYVQNVNNYLVDLDYKKCMEVDLDGNKQTEYIIGFFKDNMIYVSLFDSSANFVVNLVSDEGKKELNEIIEIADVDNDGIMEIIVVKGSCLEVHRYSNGFYY